MAKNFEDLTSKELWQLRQEIVTNSIFIAHYTNSFGFDASDICTFFDGYYDYLWELANEDYDDCLITDGLIYDQYDNENNLYSWFNCYDDLSWIKCKEYEEDFDTIY